MIRENVPRRQFRKKGRRMNSFKKGVYILPNFLTSLSLFCGFYSVVSTMQGSFLRAAWAIVAAAVFDGLDGRIARMTGTTSRFGVEYDSLCDLVAFGVAPAVLTYGWILNQYGRWGWLAAFLYVGCGAIRLARFNTMTGSIKSDVFLGLPIPAAAGMIASFVVFCFHFSIVDTTILSVFLILTIYLLAFLMVSSLKYRSFKNLDLMSRKPFNAVVVAILLICVIAAEPQIMLFSIGVIYFLSGPVDFIIEYIRNKQKANKKLLYVEDSDDPQKTTH